MLNLPDDKESSRQEILSKVQTFREPVHSDFGWWKERSGLKNSDYRAYLRSPIPDEPVAPPLDVLRTLDKFESLLAWLETKSLGQEMTAYEKAQIACKLLDSTSSHDLSVSFGTTPVDVNLSSDSYHSIDVNLKGDPERPISARVEGAAFPSNPVRIEKND
jgi:hypothetical protein